MIILKKDFILKKRIKYYKTKIEKGDMFMEIPDIISRLNDDLTGEVEAILVYMNHHFTVADKGTQLEMLEIALDEMRHVQWLSEAIVDLGGEPELTPRRLRFNGKNVKEALSHGKMLEHEAIIGYEKHMEEIDNPAIKRMLNHIKEEEEDHLGEFSELLEEMEKSEEDRNSTVGDLTK